MSRRYWQGAVVAAAVGVVGACVEPIDPSPGHALGFGGSDAGAPGVGGSGGPSGAGATGGVATAGAGGSGGSVTAGAAGSGGEPTAGTTGSGGSTGGVAGAGTGGVTGGGTGGTGAGGTGGSAGSSGGVTGGGTGGTGAGGTGGSAGSSGGVTGGGTGGTTGGTTGGGTGGTGAAGSGGTGGSAGGGTGGTGAAGSGGTGGSSNCGTVPGGWDFLNYAADGWALRFSDPPELMNDSAMSAAPSPLGGSPPPSIRIYTPFSGVNEKVQYAHQFASPVDMRCMTITLDIMLQTGFGTASNPGIVKLYVKSSGWVYASSDWTNLDTVLAWVVLSLDPDSPHESDPGFDPSAIVELGVEIATGSTGLFGDALIYFDNVAYN